jgi:lysophospholipase L1-like esterase
MWRRPFGRKGMGVPIAFWGDSMTVGTNASTPNTTYPAKVGNAYTPFRPIFAGGIFGEDSGEIATRFLARGNSVEDAVSVFWMGTNDATPFGSVLSNFALCVDDLPSPKRFIVIPPNPKASHSVPTMAALQACVATVVSAYPNNVVNALAVLQAGGDGSPTDNSDIAAGKVPSSLLSDQTHLNDAGYALVATAVKSKIDSLDY